MLRQAAAGLRRAASRGLHSGFVARAEEAAAPGNPSIAAFTEKFVARAPSTMTPPNYPTDFVPKSEAPAATPDKVTLNFYMPHAIEFQAQKVDQISIPAVSGEFGVLPGHVPVIAQLKPGVLAVHLETDKNVKKYFVSSGFAFVHADSTTDVCAIEAVPLEQLDGEVVKQSLADYQAKLVNAKDDYEKAAAQVGIEVCSAMNAALGN